MLKQPCSNCWWQNHLTLCKRNMQIPHWSILLLELKISKAHNQCKIRSNPFNLIKSPFSPSCCRCLFLCSRKAPSALVPPGWECFPAVGGELSSPLLSPHSEGLTQSLWSFAWLQSSARLFPSLAAPHPPGKVPEGSLVSPGWCLPASEGEHPAPGTASPLHCAWENVRVNSHGVSQKSMLTFCFPFVSLQGRAVASVVYSGIFLETGVEFLQVVAFLETFCACARLLSQGKCKRAIKSQPESGGLNTSPSAPSDWWSRRAVRKVLCNFLLPTILRLKSWWGQMASVTKHWIKN